MADPAPLMDALDAVFRAQDRRFYTLEFAFPRWQAAKRQYELDVEILLPMVEGSLYRSGDGRPINVKGRVIQFTPSTNTLGNGESVLGEFVFRLSDDYGEVRVPLPSSFVKGLGDAVTWFREALTPYESEDLSRHLVRLVRDAGARFEEVIGMCRQLATSENPADALEHAELLWARARLLMVLNQDRAAAEYVVRGCRRAEFSGLPLGSRMVRAGRGLALLLERAQEEEAAQQVKRILPAVHDWP
ncbi:hypothetical protein ACFZAR_23690 [Streptomyces sp. NPDC008222]|uniref:hypothetical protein n=1 Tax=Streptomyces sp. NPDC008222 TaxID=3364820 RepID=UPI0036EC7C35